MNEIADKSGFAKNDKPTSAPSARSTDEGSDGMGEGRRQLQQQQEHPKGHVRQAGLGAEGLEGVCIPSDLDPTDHRGTMTVSIDRGKFQDGKVKINKVADTVLKREDRWLGQ